MEASDTWRILADSDRPSGFLKTRSNDVDVLLCAGNLVTVFQFLKCDRFTVRLVDRPRAPEASPGLSAPTASRFDAMIVLKRSNALGSMWIISGREKERSSEKHPCYRLPQPHLSVVILQDANFGRPSAPGATSGFGRRCDPCKTFSSVLPRLDIQFRERGSGFSAFSMI